MKGNKEVVQLNIRKDLNIPFDEANAFILETLRSEGFAILVKTEFQLNSNEHKRTMMIRTCYPREEFPIYMIRARKYGPIRCNLITQETNKNQTIIEILKPISLADYKSPKVIRLSKEADFRIMRIFSGLENVCYKSAA